MGTESTQLNQYSGMGKQIRCTNIRIQSNIYPIQEHVYFICHKRQYCEPTILRVGRIHLYVKTLLNVPKHSRVCGVVGCGYNAIIIKTIIRVGFKQFIFFLLQCCQFSTGICCSNSRTRFLFYKLPLTIINWEFVLLYTYLIYHCNKILNSAQNTYLLAIFYVNIHQSIVQSAYILVLMTNLHLCCSAIQYIEPYVGI